MKIDRDRVQEQKTMPMTPGRRISRYASYLGGVVGLALLMYRLAPYAVEEVRTPTAQEMYIASVLDEITGSDDIKVHCVNDLPKISGNVGQTGAIGLPFGRAYEILPLIALDKQLVCDPLTSNVDPVFGRRDLAVQGAIQVATHEAMHYKYNEREEGVAVCYEIQSIGEVALAFGVDPKAADSMAKDSASRGAQPGLGLYTPPADCVAGGAHDLGIPGVFPGEPGYYPYSS